MDNKYLLSSLENTLKMIDLMTTEREMGITELSTKMHLGKSTVHRILNTLLKYDYVTQNESTGKYSLAFKFVNVANEILQKYDIITVTRDRIEDMVDELDENAVLCSFANDQITTIENYACRNRAKIVLYYTGFACPAYASSAGRVFIGQFTEQQYDDYLRRTELNPITPFTITSAEELEKVILEGRDKGYFVCDQEINEGVVSISAPIFNGQGKIEAAVTVYGAASRIHAELENIGELLLETAAACTEINRKILL